jgi:1-acyl-sn-glycerol-3-phosphate acyltransferase
MVFLIMFLLMSIATTIGLSGFFAYPVGFLGYLFYLLTFMLAVLLVIVVLMVFFILVFLISGKKHPKAMFKHHVLNYYAYFVFVFLKGVRFKVIGKENLPKNSKFVIFANHIEYTDPIYLKIIFNRYPIAFVSKEVLFKNPLVNMVFRSMGSIPISPNADRSALNSIAEGIRIVKGGQPFGIFPEGKRTYSHTMIPFRPGAFKLATKADADIVPVCLYNMHEIFRKGRKPIVHVIVEVLPIITAEDYQSMDTPALAEKVFDVIDGCLKKHIGMEQKQ